MSVLAAAELEYLTARRGRARLATVAPDGNPQVSRVRFAYNPATDTVDTFSAVPATIAGLDGPRRTGCAALLVDEPAGGAPVPSRGIEIRGRAEAVDQPETILRIHPDQVISWGLPATARGAPTATAGKPATGGRETSGPSSPDGVCAFGRPGSAPAPADVFVPVEWNPLIDAAWWAKEITALRGRLGTEFPQAHTEAVDEALDDATRRIAAGAHIPNYLPILVGREARAQLRCRAGGQPAGPPAGTRRDPEDEPSPEVDP
jgi:pyridoxamine 5'-phosphate oxidase family protein